MEKSALLEKIALFPITVRGLSEDLRGGAYRSVFRGNGIEFDEVREYRSGDDIRAIDRNVSARFGRPFVKRYREEREVSMCVVLDTSLSMMEQGGASFSRADKALIAFSLLGFSAEKAGQRFGAVFFDGAVRSVWPCRQGLPHIFSMVDTAFNLYEAAGIAAVDAGRVGRKGRGYPPRVRGGTALAQALMQVSVLCRRRSLVVIISDFLAAGWETELPRLALAHDCVCIRPELPAERDFPVTGLTVIEDVESGVTLDISASAGFKAAWTAFFEKRIDRWQEVCLRSGAAALTLSPEEEVEVQLSQFFGKRRRQ